MNKQNAKEGFVRNTEPVVDAVEPDNVVDLESGAPVVEEPFVDKWPVTVRLLHKPVRDNKGNVLQELTFREPTGGDINRHGNPCHITQDGEVQILDRKMLTMMAVLSGVLQPFLEGMDTRDYNSCAYRLRGFFLPDPAAW